MSGWSWLRKNLSLIGCLAMVACGGGDGGSGSGGTASSSSVPATSPNPSSAVSSLASVEGSSLGNSSAPASTASQSTSSPAVGMAARPVNKTCLAPPPVASGAVTFRWQAAFPSLPSISEATNLIQAPDEDRYWYALRQGGSIVRFANQASANGLTVVLDIEDRVDFGGGETGLLGIAFHPQFASNRYVYLYYMGRSPANRLESRVARYQFAADGTIDSNNEMVLLRFEQPFSNHNGGQLAFGQDGFLYISSGDGGSGGDPQQNGQNKNNLLGKILRIDVNTTGNGKNYGIPTDNPFAGGGGAPEIWAYGLRNPWRFSFDKLTGELWAGDVGQGAWEEINLVTRNGNYGWGDMEGDSCYSGRPNCSTADKIKPLLSISHSTGVCSVIGGFVYRGSQYPAAVGKYFFTDYCLKTMQSITRNGDGSISVASHGTAPGSIVSFAQDNQGELYALGQSGAGTQVLKLSATGGELAPGVMASRLSATGCVDATNPKLPSAAMIPYTVESQLWSDSAGKERFFALPDNSRIELNPDGDFLFPVGSVLMKHFKLGDRWVETRLFARGELGWQGFSYEWRDDQADATLLADAKEKTIDGIRWQYPSQAQCLVCHTQVANFALGLETRQLNAAMHYPGSGITANQLQTLAHIQLFSAPLDSAQLSQKLYPLTDTNANLAQRARSYLDSNCSACHRPGGPTPVNLDLRLTTGLADTHSCNQPPMVGDMGVANARLIAPGEPARSVVLARMNVRDGNQMPPLASHLVDEAAVQVVSDWIASLDGCD